MERIKIKSGTTDDWNKAIHFIPLKNEPILYTDVKKMKIGDGKSLVKDLPFFDSHNYKVENEILSF